MTLPDCMMPDGAEPCKGYTELYGRAINIVAFLHNLASRLEGDDEIACDPMQAAADCREMAERLRK